MPSWQGKSKGTTLGYRIFVSILNNFGVLPAYFLLRFVAFHYFLFSYKSSKNIFDYFHKKLGYSTGKSLFKLYQNYHFFGQTIIDKVVMMSGIRNKFTFDFDGEENLRKIVGLKRGGLLLSSHIGNWEIAGHLLKRLGTRINVVMYDGEHEQIKKYLTQVTGERQVNVIVIKNDLSHIYALNDAFKNNELVCMHADRFLEGNKTLSNNFLGNNANFPMGPFVLAAKFKVPVSYVFAMKESTTHYHLFASEIKEYAHLGKDIVMQQMLSDFVAEMEVKVKKYPEQWYNYYNFWQS
ncbi:MAG: lipid A biosynthesis acyltransferase [Sphingobacteriales bacterium]|nr:lipid A biosynthesis acyltransferase [Sphingobacteriales bacterium]